MKGKAAGPDGIPSKLYVALEEVIIPVWVQLFNAILLEGSPIPNSWNEAVITSLLKSGRLNRVAGQLIHRDRQGFLLRDLIRTLIGAIDLATTLDFPLAVVTVDAVKAFDRMNWKYLMATLAHLGIDESLIKVLLKIYSAPSAKIQVNGILSSKVKIGRPGPGTNPIGAGLIGNSGHKETSLPMVPTSIVKSRVCISTALQEMERMLARGRAGKPLANIFGHIVFGGESSRIKEKSSLHSS
ncbi:hypothetical protein NDU88_002519 [Pleurodeles waltl]|uniref:Reverse transcriptase domain-containing protein n=1 Tax=Pleurodeles waltl TaxID=8319 RepID=A0AAV7KSC6_PLEWA|nr:hypothetical protein NDU88_002519 [Pleurodeles waltl]